MTERALTKEGIFKTFKLQVARREPRPDRVGKEGVPPFIDFVEFRDKQGVLRYATPVAHYDGPKIFSSESSPQPRETLQSIQKREREQAVQDLVDMVVR
ncbi:MAG TPA: hypothetical protein VMR59_01300 [Patescibacteria group bacterium]|jgi:hypothetical protein|nr:hypothetical protein [Patescibacteria group bacterium]